MIVFEEYGDGKDSHLQDKLGDLFTYPNYFWKVNELEFIKCNIYAIYLF